MVEDPTLRLMNPRAYKHTRLPELPIAQLAQHVQVGDLVFIRVSALPFQAVAYATDTWTNHVGIVADIEGDEPRVGESSFPFSRTTTLSKFVSRSEQGRVAITRLKTALTPQQVKQIQLAVQRRHGVFYDTGFSLYSRGQFCSRYAHEVLNEATGIAIGKVETLKDVLTNKPDMKLGFWRLWFFGKIPWGRQTITPASLLNSAELTSVFSGNAIVERHSLWRAVKQLVKWRN
jgi:hypothetical protein